VACAAVPPWHAGALLQVHASSDPLLSLTLACSSSSSSDLGRGCSSSWRCLPCWCSAAPSSLCVRMLLCCCSDACAAVLLLPPWPSSSSCACTDAHAHASFTTVLCLPALGMCYCCVMLCHISVQEFLI
jgi:hypothetical protein